MSAYCRQRLIQEGQPAPRTCARCGLGPCVEGIGSNPPNPPSGGSAVTSPPLSEPVKIDARARAFDLAMKLAAQSQEASEINFPRLVDISNRIYVYLTTGR